MANLTNSNKLIEKIDNLNVVRVSNTAPSNPTLGMAWYDSTSSSKMLKIYNGTSRDIVGPEMIPITQDAYDALSPAEKNNGKYYLITDADGTIIVNWEDIVGAPTIPENTSDLNNDSGFITGINSSDVTTALGFTPYNASNPSGYQTASQVSSAINTALGSVYRYKGSKTTYSQLPTSGQVTGDVWNIEQADSQHGIKAGDNVAWNGSAWDVLSGTVDLTNYFNKTTDNSDSITQGSNNLFLTGAERTKLGNLSGTNTGDETTATIKTKLGAASASQDGYLKKEDFATFNGKQDVLTAGDGITIDENGVISSDVDLSEYQEKLTAGNGINIENTTHITDLQGPCPEGYHIPTYQELQELKIAVDEMIEDAISQYGPMPEGYGVSDFVIGDIINWRTFQGIYTSEGLSGGGELCILWSSEAYNSNDAHCMTLRTGQNITVENVGTARAIGAQILPFGDDNSAPDESSIDGSQVFDHTGIYTCFEPVYGSNGLINQVIYLSYANKTKRLKLFVVQHNDNTGDSTITFNNRFFQRGNNNGRYYDDDEITTSSTQVDASGYGPGNYYSSETFITASNDWSSVRNDNLWGGVSYGVVGGQTIKNTGVLSVNGQTGNVNINIIEYAPGTGIDINYAKDYSAMRGPCEQGYHLPTTNDIHALFQVVGGGYTGNGAGRGCNLYLLLPNTNYYTSDSKWGFQINNNNCSITSYSNSSLSGSRFIREFKDSYVKPDGQNWEQLDNRGKIFHNKNLGLISITDGQFTIKDKNLGATEVYRPFDPIKETTGGKRFQWGNNYNFPYDLQNITTSSEKVDVSDYGPSSYYDSTFILSDDDWRTTESDESGKDLWGGVTGYQTINNVISNKGVLSFNGGTGDVTFESNEYHDGKGISIITNCDYSAIKGPCPEGFHIPTKSEWESVKSICDSLSLSDTDRRSIFSLPSGTGYIDPTDGEVFSNGGEYLWISTTTNEGSNKVNAVSVSNFSINTVGRSKGCNIRAFKNEPVIPDNTWSTASGTQSLGIFKNSSLGLISLTNDGENWITMQDTSLNGYYQYGNNYAFIPNSQGKITNTTTTQVDTTGYGPGNYYSSDAFFKNPNGTYNGGDWHTDFNPDLWGGRTEVVCTDNTITNTGVLSVNGQTGDVTIDAGSASSITTTQPSNPVEGDVYYDTTNDVVKVYDGTNWNEVGGGETYTAGDGIDITNNEISAKVGAGLEIGDDYTAMQGPCPSGFHVPSKDEWVSLCGVLTTTFSMAANKSTLENYLKMPGASYRQYNSYKYSGEGCYYWSSTNANSQQAYKLVAGDNSLNPSDYTFTHTIGANIRPFKDSPIIPDSSWTTLYDGSSIIVGAGIFHNTSLGLISISGDGQNRITISDKNLGATIVFNSGDTKDESNCGKHYQRGNNYGFSYNLTAITDISSTQVDTTGYGPGNYYSSSTWINKNGSWFSPTNDNLRGGVTGVITDVIYNVGVRSINRLKGDVNFKNGKNIKIGSRDSRQGPCPDGFIIPSSSDFSDIINMGVTLGAWTSSSYENMFKYLKIGPTPYIDINGNYIYNSYGIYTNGGPFAYLWTRTYNNGNSARRFYLQKAGTGVSIYDNAIGSAIRPIKPEPIIPDSSWTTLFDGSSVATNAGIFYNSTLGLISISADGINWKTIADKNVGATVVFDKDNISIQNAQKKEVCGYLFQRGNNYPFTEGSNIFLSSQVDASEYGPSEYYSELFVKGYASRQDTTKINKDLRGDLTGIIDGSISNIESKYTTINDLKKSNIAQESDRMGPCPSGFHVPSTTDFDNFDSIMFTLTGKTRQLDLYYDNVICGYLKMPGTGRRSNSSPGGIASPTYRYFWTCGRNSSQDGAIGGYYGSSRSERTASGLVIRPFKNEPVIPDNTWTTMLDGSTIAEGAGVFWNEDDGIISVSADGTTWMTIADKNCGATKVWNYGDAVTDENKGLYYQWGNNYGFPASGDLPKTSTTRVSTTGYGPGNYFYGDTFIFNNSSWESPENYNLWGDRTGGTWGNGLYNAGVISVNGQKGHLKGIATESYVKETIINTSVLSVNGQTGNVGGAIVSSDTPSTPIIGTLWYDTTNSVLKLYNGSSWISI